MNTIKKIIFLGSPEFAVPSLQALIQSERWKPIAVITQPDRPAGRNLALQPTPIKELALKYDIPVLQPEDINDTAFVDELLSYHPDMLVTVAYGSKLGKAIRQSAPFGAINLHPSLLPALRGAAPIPFALWEGALQTGITIFRLVGRMDAGPVYMQEPLYIFSDENTTFLSNRLSRIGASLLMEFLDKFSSQPWEPIPQDESKATYCRKLEREDGLINWSQTALEINNQIRALSLSPGAYSFFRKQPLKILEAELHSEEQISTAGTIIGLVKNTGFIIQTDKDQLLVTSVQPSGKKPMSAWAYHLGARIESGEGFTDA